MTRISKFGTRGPRNSSHHGSPSREFFFFFYRVDPSPGIGRVFLDRVDRWKRSRSNWFKGLFFFISSNWRRAISLAISESRLVENYMEERGET